MTPDDFRRVFRAADHLLPITRVDGSPALGVGLNGSNAVLHGGAEIALDRLSESPFGIYERSPDEPAVGIPTPQSSE